MASKVIYNCDRCARETEGLVELDISGKRVKVKELKVGRTQYGHISPSPFQRIELCKHCWRGLKGWLEMYKNDKDKK